MNGPGAVITLGGDRGSVSVIGAVSPPGGDFSEPVTQHTKRFVSTFWALDKELASARYFPGHQLSQQLQRLCGCGRPLVEGKGRGSTGSAMRDRALAILKEEARLQNIVKLIGEDALPDDQKATFYGARLIKEDFLQQSAFDPIDTYCCGGKAGPDAATHPEVHRVDA